MWHSPCFRRTRSTTAPGEDSPVGSTLDALPGNHRNPDDDSAADARTYCLEAMDTADRGSPDVLAQAPEERLPPLGVPLLEDEQREAVSRSVLPGDLVPSEMLDGHPGLGTDSLEADAYLGLLVGREAGLTPSEPAVTAVPTPGSDRPRRPRHRRRSP